jgi:hypothetical protein
MVDRRAGRKIEAPPNKLIRQFRVENGDAALGTVLPGCMPGRLHENESKVLLNRRVSFYVFPVSQSCASLVMERQKPLHPIFVSSLANMFVE